ncbi:MAG: hypothetical protein GQ566_04505 [Methanosarcinales archaeon]|nr:hypothetical protein [Methanosarcinales archaeon]
MFIDIFDTIKKYTIHGIITILLLAIYSYLSNNAVDDGLYRSLLGVFSYVVVSACSYGLFSCLLHFLDQFFYLSDEERYAFIRSKKALPVGILSVICFLLYINYEFSYIDSVQELKEIVIILIIACILCIMIVYFLDRWFFQKNDFYYQSNKNENPPILSISIMFIWLIIIVVSVFSWHLLFVSLTSSPQFQGNIDSNMQDKYHMSDSPIHTLIRATGPDTGLSVEFKSESSDRNYDAIIYLDKNNESMSNKSLNGKLTVKGEYSIYINITDMSVGHYNLICTRQKYVESYSLKRTYLEND